MKSILECVNNVLEGIATQRLGSDVNTVMSDNHRINKQLGKSNLSMSQPKTASNSYNAVQAERNLLAKNIREQRASQKQASSNMSAKQRNDSVISGVRKNTNEKFGNNYLQTHDNTVKRMGTDNAYKNQVQQVAAIKPKSPQISNNQKQQPKSTNNTVLSNQNKPKTSIFGSIKNRFSTFRPFKSRFR